MQVINTWINTLKSENSLTVNLLTAILLNIEQSNSVNHDHRLKHIVFVIILFSRRGNLFGFGPLKLVGQQISF